MTEEDGAGVEELPESVFYERLHKTHGSGCDPRIVLEDESSLSHPTEARIGKLRSHSPGSRYILRGEIGQGGMGTVYRAFDVDLRRIVAMKVMREKSSVEPKSGGSPPSSPGISRFLEEAQITGQLDHPGIVPVHDLGIDPEDRVYFTMRQVHGGNLRQTFDYFHTGRFGWSLTRCVGILLRVCETMSYAHSRGVVHRDLKPENVMVGEYGEVVVLDWGVAKVLPRKKGRSPSRSSKPIWTDRFKAKELERDLLAATHHGTVIGTPAFMAPEQASGNVAATDARSDVHAVGAMLYFLLTGRTPYEVPGIHTPRLELLAKVLSGPPTPIRLLTRKVPPELVAICEKAMQRDPDDRYTTMKDMADDVRSYLEGQVVAAHGTGRLHLLSKWGRKNRRTILTGSAALVLAAIALALAVRNERLWNSAIHAARSTLAAENEALAHERNALRVDLEHSHAENARIEEAAQTSEDRAERMEAMAAAGKNDALSLRQELQEMARLLREARATSALMKGLEQDLTEERDLLKAEVLELSEWRERGQRAETVSALVSELPEVYRLLAQADALWPRYGAGVRSYQDWLVRAREQATVRDSALASGLDSSPELGAKAGIKAFLEISPALIADVERRQAFARKMADLASVDRELEWNETISAIASSPRSRGYKRLRLTPQHNLVPLGQDLRSKLFEFAHVGTGDIPRRDSESGELVFGEESALVFVLVPGGSFEMGFERGDVPDTGESDAGARPVHTVELEPFFLSKFEMTEAQWGRVAGGVPTGAHGGLDPVAGVPWSTAVAALDGLGLRLPTEAQWEYAARAGSDTPWWTDKLGRVQSAVDHPTGGSFPRKDAIDNLAWDDGFSLRAPVHAFPSNPFGMHGLLGNVSEWTLDSWSVDNSGYPVRIGDGLHQTFTGAEALRSVRGGAYLSSSKRIHMVGRFGRRQDATDWVLGIRPARPLFP